MVFSATVNVKPGRTQIPAGTSAAETWNAKSEARKRTVAVRKDASHVLDSGVERLNGPLSRPADTLSPSEWERDEVRGFVREEGVRVTGNLPRIDRSVGCVAFMFQ